MTTIFSKIIQKEIPAQFVYEDDVCIVVMDKFPAVEGQTLVIPKREVDYIFDLPEDVYQHLFLVAKKIAQASDKAFSTIRTCLAVEGFEVPHVHVKLYPVTGETKNLAQLMLNPTEKSDEELEKGAQKIKKEL